ncbi:S8 family peptidase [Oscillospiraceae bacterium PP1C4]
MTTYGLSKRYSIVLNVEEVVCIPENTLSLDEFIKLPTTVAFGKYQSNKFKAFVKNNPYIKIGTEFPTGYVVSYTNKKNIPRILKSLGSDIGNFFPIILSPLDFQATADAGITQVINHPYLNLSGRGVIVGIVDTGIDYTKEVFRNEDGTSKIISIWDQTIDGERPEKLHYGAVYSKEVINEALKTDNPFEVVPSMDADGHGTFLASVAAGKKTKEHIGAAPDADLLVVKVRRANQYYIDEFCLLPDAPNLYETTDYLLGIKYIFDKAAELNAPVVLCVGMGSNSSTHSGSTAFEEYLTFLGKKAGHAVVTAVGNESNAKHHTEGVIPKTGAFDVVRIRVGKQTTTFSVNIVASGIDTISIGIVSPTGEVVGKIPYKIGLGTREQLILTDTTVSIGYYKEAASEIFVGFKDARQGIWEILLFGDSIASGKYHAWLPITGQVDPEVDFLEPVPDSTIVFPGSARRVITCGSYNSHNNSLFVSSSWGSTNSLIVTPNFVAPGVDVSGIYPRGSGSMTGTSVAAAITAGAAALLLEWGINRGNLRSMNSDLIRQLLSAGCEQDEALQYPNFKWGYGKLDLYETFIKMARSNL